MGEGKRLMASVLCFRQREREVAVAQHFGDGKEQRQVELALDFRGALDARVEEQLEAERQPKPAGNQSEKGAENDLALFAQGWPGRTRGLRDADVSDAARSEGLVHTGLFAAGDVIAVVGFIKLFLAL